MTAASCFGSLERQHRSCGLPARAASEPAKQGVAAANPTRVTFRPEEREDQMPRAPEEEFDWQPFIGRALAYLCLDAADMGSNTTLERAEFLMKLGLPRKEAAVIVGSSDESLRVLARQKAKRAGTKRKGTK